MKWIKQKAKEEKGFFKTPNQSVGDEAGLYLKSSEIHTRKFDGNKGQYKSGSPETGGEYSSL